MTVLTSAVRLDRQRKARRPSIHSFFSAHFASTSSCFFLGSFRCFSQRNLNRGPFDRFVQPG